MSLIDGLYISTFTHTRMSGTADGQGGWTQSPSVLGTIQGRMRPATATERVVAVQRQAEISHVLYCGADENVLREDVLTGEGRTWTVEAIREPSHAGHHLEIEVLELQKKGEP